MSSAAKHTGVTLDWDVRACSMEPGAPAGDAYVVRECDAGTLLAVIDGEGHGEPARRSAVAASRILEAHAGEPLERLISFCHEALGGSRGAAITLGWFPNCHSHVEWLGVGDVEGWIIRAHGERANRYKSVALRNGLVGYRVPPLRPAVVELEPRDLLIFATDGINLDFADRVDVRRKPGLIANDILDHSLKGTDDALVLVARYMKAGE
jgi:negative regulator of sigma-B (phosphoserine phosphatase)